MSFVESELLELVIAGSIIIGIAIAGFWFWVIVDCLEERIGRWVSLALKLAAPVLVIVSSISFYRNLEYMSDRINLNYSILQFIEEYRDAPEAAMDRYSVRINEYERIRWKFFMDGIGDRSVITEVRFLGSVQKRADVRDQQFIFAILYESEEEKRFKVFIENDLSGGKFEPARYLYWSFFADEIEKLEANGWKFER